MIRELLGHPFWLLLGLMFAIIALGAWVTYVEASGRPPVAPHRQPAPSKAERHIEVSLIIEPPQARPERPGLQRDLVAALVQLGYKQADAVRTAKRVVGEDDGGGNFEFLLPRALWILSRR